MAAIVAASVFACGCGERTPTARGGGPAAPSDELWIAPSAVARIGLEIEPAEERELSNELTAGGRIAFDDTRVTHVFSPVPGRVTRLIAAPGQRVRRGDALAVIASPEVGTASADLRKAVADVIAATHDVERQRRLVDEGAGTMRDVEQAVDTLRRARAERDRARQRLGLLNAEAYDHVTQAYTLRAEIDGEVLARNANPGLEVAGQYTGGTPTELFTIGEIDRVWALADVYEADLPRVSTGAAVTVRVVSWPERTFEGTVAWVSGALDAQTHTARVRCVLANDDRALRPEMVATVAIQVPARRALAIPRSAVLRAGDATIVFVERGRAANGQIRLARTLVVADESDSGGRWVRIERGLQRGERVVTANAIQLLGMLQ